MWAKTARLIFLKFLMFASTMAMSGPVMLANHYEAFVGGGSNYYDPAIITGEKYNLLFGPPFPIQAALFPGQNSFDANNGFYVQFGVGGKYDFNSTNSIGFSAIANLLTDGVDGSVGFWSFDGGSGTGNSGSESNIFGGLLTGDSIDFLRLIVHYSAANVWRRGSTPAETYYFTQLVFEWQVWGTGPVVLPAAIAPAPEPATSWLAVTALLVMATVRKRKLGRAS